MFVIEDEEDEFENVLKDTKEKKSDEDFSLALKELEKIEKDLTSSINSLNVKNKNEEKNPNEDTHLMKMDKVNFELYLDFKTEYLTYKEILLNQLLFISSDHNNLPALNEIRRILHALKGGFNTISLLKLGKEIHELETLLNGYENKLINDKDLICKELNSRLNEVFYYFEEVEFNPNLQFDKNLFEEDKREDLIQHENEKNNKEKIKDFIQKEKNAVQKMSEDNILISLEELNGIVDMQDTYKMLTTNLVSETKYIRSLIEELEENLIYLDKNIHELETYAENNIQSNFENKDRNSSFDPLLLDRFTKLQEMSRSLVENFLDAEEVKKNLLIKTKLQLQNVEKLNNLTNTTSEKLIKMRLVEFKTISKRFFETHKRVCKELNKDVDLILVGGDTLVDITLTNKIRTPIEHIIRNSIGHGIEDEKIRKELGKPKKGKIVLEIKPKANFLNITISDDGYGLNVQKIRKKAIEKGLITEKDEFTSEDAVKFILMPNFSTADKITDISGRGVGMEAVQAEVIKNGGTFAITSVEKKGMTIKISLPTSYTTTYGLVCRVGEQEVVILNNIIKEVFSFTQEEFKKIEKNAFMEYQGKQIPVRSLSNILKIKSPFENKMFYRVLLLEERGELFGIHIDEIINNQEILIKNATRNLSYIPGLVGITTLVSGKPLFVINPFACKKYELDRLKLKTLPPELFTDEKYVSNNDFFVPLIMVVDDSAVIRKTTEKFLDNHGFKHVSAKHGKDALEKLSHYDINLILLDIEMPEMNGFEFAEIIKQNQLYKNIPIIMITSRINEVHKQKAKSLGVKEYLIKPFVPNELLKLIKHYAYKK